MTESNPQNRLAKASFQAGTTAIAKHDTVSGRAGDAAVCYRVYELDGVTRYCFVFERGGTDNFTRESAEFVFHVTGHCPSVATYTGQFYGEVLRDFARGRFAAAFPLYTGTA